MLHVRVLGPVEVVRDGNVVDLGGPQQRTVIAHLAVEAGRVVSVERLIDRIWGDDPPRTPLGTLQSYVSRLRRALEPERAAGAAPQILVSEAPGYVLRLPDDAIDLFRFEALAADGRAAAGTGRFAEAVAAFDEGLALWRGDALAGIGPDEQVRPIVVRLGEARASVVEDRFEALLSLGRHAEIVPDLQAAVDAEPLRERRWSQLAVALYRSRRQADALRALGTARETLLDELGLDPGPELRELEQRILAQDPSLDTPTSVTITENPVRPTGRRSVEIVGREPEWASVVAALDAASDRSRLLLVEGEPGIGKSTICEALLAHADGVGWATVVGRCVESGLAPTMWPAIEITRGVLRHEAAGRLDDDVAPRLRALVTAGRPVGTLPPPVELAAEFVELLDACGPIRWLFFVDDLHWADRATLDLMALVQRRLEHRTVLVVGAYRPLELVPGAPLAGVLGELHRLPDVDRVTMSPLGRDDVARLIEITSGSTPDPVVASRVAARAGGNPLFVTELARLTGERGIDATAEVPTAIRDVVRSRLAQLPDHTTAELQVAAVLGERFDLHLAMEASERDPDACLDALDAAIATRILVPDGESYRFAHALVRDAVLADTTPLRRARLHHRAAEAIIAVRGEGPDEAEPIAYHRLGASAITPPPVVAKALVRASDVARWRNAFDQALLLAEQAIDVVAAAPRSPELTWVEFAAFEALVSLEYRRNDGVEAELAVIADDLAERTGSDTARAMALFLRWGDVDSTDDVRSLEPGRDAAIALAESTAEPYASVICHYMVGGHAMLVGDIDEARRRFRLSVEAAGSDDPDVPPAHTPIVLTPVIGSFAAAVGGDAEAARVEAYQRAPAWVAERAEVDPTAAMALTWTRAMVEALLDEPDRVRKQLTGVDFAGVGGFFDEQEAALRILWSWSAAELDGDVAAVATGRDAADALRDAAERVLRPCLNTFQARAELRIGSAECVRFVHAAREEAERSGEVWWLAETLRVEALIEHRFGDRTAVAALLDDAEALARRQGAHSIAARIAVSRAAVSSA